MCDKTQDIVILKTIFSQIIKWGLQQNITLSKTNGGFKVPDLQNSLFNGLYGGLSISKGKDEGKLYDWICGE